MHWVYADIGVCAFESRILRVNNYLRRLSECISLPTDFHKI